MNNIELRAENLIEEKISAIKRVYHDWGFILRRALRELAPQDTGLLRSAIRFRVDSPKKKADITGTVRLLVGILDPTSPVLKYLHVVVGGNRNPRFVPGQSNTAIFRWAQRHNLIYYGKDGSNSKDTWRWKVPGKSGKLKGKPFHGMKVFAQPNDFFTQIYLKYHNEISSDISRILKGE